MILVGEMRDLETIGTALTAAETGHLVFATLHTQSAPSTIDRVIDVFPAEQQDQVRVQLASTLQGVVTQNLVPTADGLGRTAALEILIPDDAVRNLIRQAKIEQIYSVMQTSTSRGMQTMEQSLADLVMRRVVTPEVGVRPLVAARPAARPPRARRLRHPATAQCHRDGRSGRRAASGRTGIEVTMDLKKEIKLSDLFRRPKKKTNATPAAASSRIRVAPSEPSRRRSRKSSA